MKKSFFDSMHDGVVKHHLEGYLPRKGNKKTVVVIFQSEYPMDIGVADIFTSVSEKELTDEIGRRAGIKVSAAPELWVTTMSELKRALKAGRLARLLQVTPDGKFRRVNE